jgi:tRNA threonylcarbamoyladenosine biosynthesis protein TsaB
MYLLSLETSTKVFSLTVSKDEKVLRFRNIRTERILETSMVKSIDQLLKSCRLKFKDVDAVAIGLGPGSFTSLRVGLSTVKALALATGKKIVGVASLDVLASGVCHLKADEICVLLDARRGKVFAAIYDMQLKRKTEYLLTSIEDVLDRVHGKTLFVGDGIPLFKQTIEEAYQAYNQKNDSACQPLFSLEKFWYPQSQELAKLAFVRIQEQKFDDPASIVPIYLYPQDCQVTTKR